MKGLPSQPNDPSPSLTEAPVASTLPGRSRPSSDPRLPSAASGGTIPVDEQEKTLAIWNETDFEKNLRRILKKGFGQEKGDEYCVKHARYYWLLLAESHLTRRLFGAMLQRIWALPVPAG